MNRIKFASIAVVLFLCAAFTWVAVVNWKVKEGDYAIRFETKGAKGTMEGLKGTIQFDPADPAASHFDVTVDVNTINTGMGLKNKHAKAENFFDAEHYPTIHFVSKKIEKTDTAYMVLGALTIKNVQKEISIPFTFTEEGNEASFDGSFELKRLDYNLDKKGVGEIVKIELSIPVTK